MQDRDKLYLQRRACIEFSDLGARNGEGATTNALGSGRGEPSSKQSAT